MKKRSFLVFFLISLVGSFEAVFGSAGFVRELGVHQQQLRLAMPTNKKDVLVKFLQFLISQSPGPGSAVAHSCFYKNASWSWDKAVFLPTKIAFVALRDAGIDLSTDSVFIGLVRDVLAVFDTHHEVPVLAESSSSGLKSSSFLGDTDLGPKELCVYESFRSTADVERISSLRGYALSHVEEECEPVVGEGFTADFSPSSVRYVVQRKVTGNEEKDSLAFDQALKWASSFGISAIDLGHSAGSSDTKSSATVRAIATFEEESDILLREALQLVDKIKALIEAERAEKDSLSRLRSFEDSVVPTMATIQATLEMRLGIMRTRMAAIQTEFSNLQRVVVDMQRTCEHDLTGLLV